MKYIGEIDARTDTDGRDLHLSAFFSFLRLSRLRCITRVQQHQQQYASRYNALSFGFFRVLHS